MAEAVRHITRFLRVDAQIETARKHKGWAMFHRECGAQGLFFDNIEKQGRGYGALSFRVENAGAHYHSYVVSRGTGRGPIDAVIAAFDAAVSAGFPVDPTLGRLLTTETAPLVADLDALLGGPVAPSADAFMDLIG